MATTFTYAEELTLSDIRSLVLRRLRVTDTSRYSVDRSTADYDWFDDAINEGLKRFVRGTKCIRSYAIYIPISGYQVYRCPESFIDLKSAYYYDSSIEDGYRPLLIKTVGWLNNNVSDWRTKTGDPKYIYVDRMFARRWFFGLVPIPEKNGTTVDWDTDYGVELTDICSLTTYNEEFVELPQSGLFYCPNSQDSPGKPFDSINQDILIEHYRLPRKIDTTTQYPELPREYHSCLADYAAWELLRHNPEDSAEFNRAGIYIMEFQNAIKEFNEKRKEDQLAGQDMGSLPPAQSWITNLSWYKKIK